MWAKMIAERNCEYLSYGLTLEQSLQQSLRDYSALIDIMPDNASITAELLQRATKNACFSLYDDALEEYIERKRASGELNV
jgi:hypothetical protein